MDFIFIEGFRVEARVGIYPHERQAPQLVEIDLKLGLPNGAGKRDDIKDTICYETATRRIREFLLETHVDLLETLGTRLISLLFEEFGAPWAQISIFKPGILSDVKRVGIHMERKREE